MEVEKNNEIKLGDTLENLNNSIKNKDMGSALAAFKLIKENKYSLFIDLNNNFDKNNYNDIKLIPYKNKYE